MSGADVARLLVRRAGAGAMVQLDVSSRSTAHYCPMEGRIYLGSRAYFGTGAEEIATGAHEAAHAIQRQSLYLPLRLMLALRLFCAVSVWLVPGAVVAAMLVNATVLQSWPVLLIGVCVSLPVLLQCVLVMIVEVDASRRACRALKAAGVKVDHAAAAAFLRRAAWSYFTGMICAPFCLFQRGKRRTSNVQRSTFNGGV